MGSEKKLSVGTGDIIQFGDYSWKVLDVKNSKALLLSERVTGRRRYNESFIDVKWETSTLRQYLNGEFYEKFSAEDKACIAETKIPNNNNPWFNTKGGNATNDKIFLLSLGEVVKYFGDSGLLSQSPKDARRINDQYNSERIVKDADDTDSWWWLRSPGFYGLNAAYVNNGGWIYIDGNNVNLYGGGVRPALWLNIQPGKEDDSSINANNIDELSSERDSNDLKAILTKTSEADEHMHLMFDAAPLCCNLWDENLNIIECNQAAVKLFGLSDKQKYIKRFFEFSPPIQPCGKPSSELMLENIAKAFKDGDHHFEWMHRRLDGEPMPSEITLICVKYKDTHAVASYTRDLREFKTTMAKMRETDERMQLMLDATPLCCNLWDDSYNAIECNQEAVKLFELSSKQEYLERISDLSPPFQPCGRPSSETMLENIGKAFRDGYYRFEWMHQKPDGIPIPSEITLVRVKYKDGYIVAGYTRDLREHNKMMRDLEFALKKATEASKAKSDFLSSMSHEMRTPMNAIIGMTSIGKKADNAEEKNHALNKIGDASAHLLGVINDVLDMAKIEANKLELVPIEFNFEKMLQKVMTVVNFRADEKNLTLTVNVDSKIPTFIVGDDQRLAQVITNLMSNAVKFTPEGGKICIDISLIEEIDRNCSLRIEVADNGIGISAEQQKKLFKAFEQAGSGMSREYGGTGLGLVISKNIVELMDGRIWIESELGKGSKFIFIVKVQRGDKKPRSLLIPDVNWEILRILVVDDMPEVLDQFQNIFSELNIRCDVASDGLDACRIIEERGGYDIYFIDWRMPHMDGIDLTKHIKAKNSEDGRSSVVIMITSMDWEQIKNEAAVAGVDKHLLKPLFSSAIIDCVNDCIDVTCNQSEETGDVHGEFANKWMLLAEDVEINREILIALLENTGLIIDCAENGKEALDMIEASPDRYDIVFMDLQMPHMDGYEATRRIRSLPSMQRTKLPIVALTANVFTSDINECIAAGMDDHLGKPLDIDRILEVLRKYLK